MPASFDVWVNRHGYPCDSMNHDARPVRVMLVPPPGSVVVMDGDQPRVISEEALVERVARMLSQVESQDTLSWENPLNRRGWTETARALIHEEGYHNDA